MPKRSNEVAAHCGARLSNCAGIAQNLILDDDMADLLAPLNPAVKCTIIAGGLRPESPLFRRPTSATVHRRVSVVLCLQRSGLLARPPHFRCAASG